MKNFYIAGASSRSRTARVYIEYLNPDMKISAFLVSPEMKDNEPVVDGVPVVKITSSPDQIPASCPLQSEESSQESVQEMVEGVEVVEVSDVSEDIVQKKLKNGGIPTLNTSLPVYLGTRGVNHPKLEAELRAIGFTDIIPVDMQLDSKLRNAYLTKFYAENGREFLRMDMFVTVSPSSQVDISLDSSKSLLSSALSARSSSSEGTSSDEISSSDTLYNVAEEKADSVEVFGGADEKPGRREEDAAETPAGCIYVASSIFDGKLEDEYSPIREEHRIQVGCAVTDKRLEGCDTFDNEGENISNLNKHFCELTGLYWIWKNATEDYVGLVHYRRHFLLPGNWIDVCRQNDIDVILPVPLYVNPSVVENYRERHTASDWDYLMEYFKNNLPDEYDEIVRILGGNLYSPCNMIIARREVLDELCCWMFPIIFDVYRHGEEMRLERSPYQSRYPGFISERLITYYFESRRDRYRVVYCNKNFLN